MKRIIFLVAALLTVFSGIAAVTAYEGHVVDIKVHVENAIGVLTNEINLGTRFPQEYVETDLTWGMSNSFYAQSRLSGINYRLFFELKPIAGHTPVPAPTYLTDYYMPLNPFMTLSATGITLELPAVYRVKPSTTVPTPVGSGVLYWTTGHIDENLCDTIRFHVDIPVFEGYYNALTDTAYKPAEWRFVQLEDNIVGDLAEEFVLVSETICGQSVKVPHADLGINFKIQVSAFVSHSK